MNAPLPPVHSADHWRMHTSADYLGHMTRRDEEALAAALAADLAGGITSHSTRVLHGILLRIREREERA